jgi:hypothetical protein
MQQKHLWEDGEEWKRLFHKRASQVETLIDGDGDDNDDSLLIFFCDSGFDVHLLWVKICFKIYHTTPNSTQ